ncbi:MFS transporter [Effusibacillus dendaii]|uniref:MFS transporter n=2 Tax=Effusibacillus dendaii TaxID=2743772 RepID=A0A7I8DCQ7_9BACL|nr:MFS transporter [Effusibacillus dendaii]
MLYVVLPTHWKEAGLTSLLEVGVLLSINRFVRLPLNPLIGFLYKRIRLKNGILFAVVLAGITTTLYGYAKGVWLWIVLRSMWGLAWSFFKLGAYLSILKLSTDRNRGERMGTYNGMYRIGSLIGMLAGGVLADIYGIRLVATVFGILAFLAVPCVFRYLSHFNESESPETAAVIGEIDRPLMNRGLLGIFVTVFLVGMSLDGMVTATLSHIIEVYYPNLVIAGMALGAATVAGSLQAVRWCLGPWLSPWIGKVTDGRVGRKRILVMLLGLSSVFLGLVPVTMPILMWLMVVLSILLVASMLVTVMDAFVSDLAEGSSKIAIMTFYTVVMDTGAALGPFLGYAAERLAGVSMIIWGTTGIMAILAVGWYQAK